MRAAIVRQVSICPCVIVFDCISPLIQAKHFCIFLILLKHITGGAWSKGKCKVLVVILPFYDIRKRVAVIGHKKRQHQIVGAANSVSRSGYRYNVDRQSQSTDIIHRIDKDNTFIETL